MNFVDELLSEPRALSAAEVISVVLEKWDSTDHGITEELSAQYPQYINDLLHIADLDCACAWNGLLHFVQSNDLVGYQRTIQALDNIGAQSDAEILRTIARIPEVARKLAGNSSGVPKQVKKQIEDHEENFYSSKENTELWELLERYIDCQLNRAGT